MRIISNRLVRNERGYALTLVLILLVVGGLVLTPLLGLMSTGLISGRVYENSMYLLYAADAGVEDGLWQVENEQLGSDLFGLDDIDYDQYAYGEFSSLYRWDYDLPGQVNGKNVTVTIENIWMPMDIPVPDAATARDIIEAGKIIVTGSPALAESRTYEIKISHDPCGGDPAVETVGIWLPPGFGYDYDGDCSLEGEDYYSEPTETPHKGGKAVVWSFSPPVSLEDFPASFTFQYEGSEGQIPSAALSWIDTTWDEEPVPGYAWDADVTIFKISSTATDPDTGKQTTVESYTVTVKLRKLGSAMSGDYHAIGNTLMTPTSSSYPGNRYRDRLYRESSAELKEGDIPSNARIEAAFLYWSGWIEEAAKGIIWAEDCNDFEEPVMEWTYGSAWDTSSGRFRATAYSKPDPGRYVTMTSGIDLSAYAGQTVEVSWEQDEDGRPENEDRLYFAFSNDGGSSWSDNIEAFRGNNPESPFTYTIPDEYLTDSFKMRFYLDGFNDWDCYKWFWIWWCIEYGPEYCYIDDIIISASAGSPVEDSKVNRVMFGTAGNMAEITTDQWQWEGTSSDSGAENSLSYSCFYDATNITKALLDPDTKSGTFTLGHVLEDGEVEYQLYDSYGNPDGTTGYPLATPAFSQSTRYQWTYAGWSLLIIYTSPETKGHQLYLFDTFRYVGLHTQVTFSITNFLAPEDTTGSHLTYFVGEGDNHYSSDYIKVNDYQLPLSGDPYEDPPVNPQNNVFNSYSNSLDDPYISGVDIDTFDMSECIEPNDSSAEVILDNGEEIYNLVYIILSFRSLVSGGGCMGYLIWG
jgi:hypothetical protein